VRAKDPGVRILPEKGVGLGTDDTRVGRRQSDIDGIAFRVDVGYKVVVLASAIMSNLALSIISLVAKLVQ
jgi:hypothetical protein